MDKFLLSKLWKELLSSGSCPSDRAPRLKKYTFAITNSAPSNDRGEHWIMIARLDTTHYFTHSLGENVSTIPF